VRADRRAVQQFLPTDYGELDMIMRCLFQLLRANNYQRTSAS
jgi:hypothetical protein